jgi:hypothetical protein
MHQSHCVLPAVQKVQQNAGVDKDESSITCEGTFERAVGNGENHCGVSDACPTRGLVMVENADETLTRTDRMTDKLVGFAA